MNQGIFPLVVDLGKCSSEELPQTVPALVHKLGEFHQTFPATPIRLILSGLHSIPDEGIQQFECLPCHIHIRSGTGEAEVHPAHLLITSTAPTSTDIRSTDAPLCPSIPSLPIPVDAARGDDNLLPPGWQNAFKVIDKVNALLAHQRNASDAQSAYVRLDTLAVEQLAKVRDKPRIVRLLASSLLCMALASIAWAINQSLLLLMLPVVVFVWLLKNEEVRAESPWKSAVHARSFAEYLRIREAVQELGISPLEIGQCFPRRDGERFLPVVLGVAGLDAVENLQQCADHNHTDAFKQWVSGQVTYYKNKSETHNMFASIGSSGFKLAFSSLGIFATAAILLSIEWPFPLPHFERPLAPSIGAMLSAGGLIAINFVRDMGAKPTADDYKYMLGVFNRVKERLDAGESVEQTTVIALIEEVLSEHASWFARTLGK